MFTKKQVKIMKQFAKKLNGSVLLIPSYGDGESPGDEAVERVLQLYNDSVYELLYCPLQNFDDERGAYATHVVAYPDGRISLQGQFFQDFDNLDQLLSRVNAEANREISRSYSEHLKSAREVIADDASAAG